MRMKTTRECNNECRKDALNQLLEKCPQWNDLSFYMDNFVSLVLSKLKLFSSSDSKVKYRMVLIASFIRTHFVILDLIESSDLIEAATLIRKQIELLARFNELDSKDIEELCGKVPNVKNVNIGATYGALSEIAHSAKFEPLSLLGVEVSEKSIAFFVYPQFNKHTLSTISIYCDVFCKFVAEILQFENISDSKEFSSTAMDIMENFITIGVNSPISYFEAWKE